MFSGGVARLTGVVSVSRLAGLAAGVQRFVVPLQGQGLEEDFRLGGAVQGDVEPNLPYRADAELVDNAHRLSLLHDRNAAGPKEPGDDLRLHRVQVLPQGHPRDVVLRADPLLPRPEREPAAARRPLIPAVTAIYWYVWKPRPVFLPRYPAITILRSRGHGLYLGSLYPSYRTSMM